MKASSELLFLFLVLVTAVAPSEVGAAVTFPQDGSTLTYASFAAAGTQQGNITASSSVSYSLQEVGGQWSVTETIVGKITCSPPTAQLSVRFLTTADITGANSIVSSDANIYINVSYIVQDRVVQSTTIGPNVPAGYSAKCALGGNDIASISQATPALYTSGFRYYVSFYVQPAGVGVGSSVPVGTTASTISAIQMVVVLGTSRLALAGTLSGILSGILFWDKESGVLLLGQSISGAQFEQMTLTNTSIPIPEFETPQILAIVATIVLFFVFARDRRRAYTR